MRWCLALFFAALILATASCSSASAGNAIAAVAEGVGEAVQQEAMPLQVLFGTETQNSQQTGMAHARAAGLRGPRGLRGLRGPRPFGTSANNLQNGLRAPGAAPSLAATAPTLTADTTPLAAYNQSTGNTSVQLGASRYTWSAQDRSITIAPANQVGLYGNAPGPSYVNYDPVSGAWTFQ